MDLTNIDNQVFAEAISQCGILTSWQRQFPDNNARFIGARSNGSEVLVVWSGHPQNITVYSYP